MTYRLPLAEGLLASTVPRIVGRASGHRSGSVRPVAESLEESGGKQPPPIGASAGAAWYWLQRFIMSGSPCHHLFILISSSPARWQWKMRDHVAGPALSRTGAQEAPRGPGAGLCAPARRAILGRVNSELRERGRFNRLANCRPQNVTLGGGGIKPCWLVFTGGLNRHSVPPKRTVPETPWSWPGGGSGSH